MKDRTIIGGAFVVVLILIVGAFATGLFTVGPSGDGGDGLPDGGVWDSGTQKLITQLNVTSTIKYSNSRSTAAGTVNFWDPDVNPSDPNAVAIDTVTLASGVGGTTSSVLMTNTPYRITFDGDATYYDAEYGGSSAPDTLPSPTTTSATISQVTIHFPDVVTVGTYEDPLEEAATDGTVNGQTTAVNITTATNEICLSSDTPADDDTLVYDESVGDGSFYIDVDIGNSQSNTEIKGAVMCFEYESSSVRPEGNELSALTMQLRTGTDLGTPSDILNYWKSDRTCIALGTPRGGASSTYRLTASVTEGNLDASDDFAIRFDDLGGISAQDIHLDTGCSAVSIDFDSQA